MSIKIENVVTPSPEQWEATIVGMRHPLLSYDWMDSGFAFYTEFEEQDRIGTPDNDGYLYGLGENDLNLMMRLRNAGPEHRKFMRMIIVYMDITAPLYWWKEADKYQIGTVTNSTSTMHKIHAKEFMLGDFSCEHLMEDEAFAFPLGGGWRGLDAPEVLKCTIEALNNARKRYLYTKDKKYWWQMIQLLPSSYNQKRKIMLNYEVLVTMYHQRKNHKLDEWREFCSWIETLPYSELITGSKKED